MKFSARRILILLCVLFVVFRLPLVNFPYHQDEWKNAVSLQGGATTASGFLTHPPLTAGFFLIGNAIFGNENLRLLPFVFSVLVFTMLYLVVKRRVGKEAALWSVGLFAVSIYSVWASLMFDTDGAILPLFFLCAVYSYDRFKEVLPTARKTKIKWGILLALSLILGILVKLSFVLVFGALLVDFLWDKRQSITKKHVLWTIGACVGAVIVGLGALYIASLVFPSFNIRATFAHAMYYASLSGRGYLQILVQATKAIYYLSPLLIIPLLFINWPIFKKTQIFSIYILLGFIFYFILFDFSKGALDKYLMFLIVPLCAIVGPIFSELWKENCSEKWEKGSKKRTVALAAVIVLLMFFANFIAQEVVPLYPKTEWFSRVLHGNFNVLTPFNGGSGPMGFYVSFIIIFLGFIGTLAAAFIAKYNRKYICNALIAMLVIGGMYNLIFIEEFMVGGINGSAPAAMRTTVAFIRNTPSIDEVLTYNDIGAYELNKIGKYAGRFYAAPQFEKGHMQKFADFEGHYMVIGIPPLYQGFYSEFFAKCATIFETHSGVIKGTVYECPTQTIYARK